MKKTIFCLVAAIGLGVLLLGMGPSFAKDRVFKWKLQTVDNPGSIEYNELSVRFADRVRELSKGRLDIKVFPPGGLVPSFEVWDAVRRGMIQMSQHFMVYWSGKEPALKFANEWAINIDPLQNAVWDYECGGLKLMRKLLARYGLYYIGSTVIGGEHIWSKKPLQGVADLKGLKMRSAGLAADSFSLLGASVVVLSPGEIYQALEKGVVDACEMTIPTVNYSLGLNEVTKYVILPTYSGSSSYDWFVNMRAWKELPQDLKTIVEVAFNETSYLYWLKHVYETAKLFEKMKKEGIKFITWSPEDMAKVQAARLEVMKRYARKSPLATEIFNSRMKLIKLLAESKQERTLRDIIEK